jgi:hypothetical protein
MDKAQALHKFWSSFGLPAYDQLTVPDGAQMPYITYVGVTDKIGTPVALTGSLWYRSTGWADITQKADEISEYVNKYGHATEKFDNGYIYITGGVPFAQRMSDDTDDMIRRIYINIMAEYLTAY